MLSVPPNNMYIGICDLDIDKGQLDFGRSSFSTACTWLRFSFEKTYFAYMSLFSALGSGIIKESCLLCQGQKVTQVYKSAHLALVLVSTGN